MLARHLNMLIGRVSGPFAFRFIVQPLVATFFAARYALSDSRTGRPPYGWAVLTNPSGNRELLREGWRHVRKVFAVAVVIDLIYEIVVFRWIYPVQTLVVAAALALLPYLLMRGFLNRIIQLWRRFGDGRQRKITREGGAAGAVMKGHP